MSLKKRGIGMYSLLAVGLFLLDRVTKYYAALYCAQHCTLNQFIGFELAFNRGVSWGMFHTDAVLPFILISLVIMVTTIGVGWLAYNRYQQGKLIIGELLVITGSVSNIIDRVLYGGVVDFIQLSYGQWTWPAFNIADVSIVLGVGFMLWELYKE